MRPSVPNLSTIRRAFSLIELMVVILIIALVIAILLPALRGARTTAKVAATQATMRDLSSATNAFTLDKKSAPGYFSAALMGSNTNEGRGFTGMKNVLLDLAGGITKAPTNGTTIIATGPGAGATGQVNVDLSLIGSKSAGSGGGYFTADKGNFTPAAGLVGSDAATIANMPEVLDSFGQPILAWSADTRPETQFAARTSGNNYVAKFYWASNAGVLGSTALGKAGKQQLWTGGDEYCSMIGYGASDQDVAGRPNKSGTLEALLGNPSFPRNGVTPARPEKARGEVVFHSAGPDGYFMGKGDKGTKMHWGAGQTSVPYVAGTDVMKDYDDLVSTANN